MRFPTVSLSLRVVVCNQNTRIYVRLLGPCFKTGPRVKFRPSYGSRPKRNAGSGAPWEKGGITFRGKLPLPNSVYSAPKPLEPAPAHRTPTRGSAEDARARHFHHRLPFQRFQALFNSLFKVLCIFPSRYLFAIGLGPIFSFRRNLPPA